jgi:ergothioneine biosynthesis protein EgtB
VIVLERFESDYSPFDPRYLYLFNSYYNALGERHARPLRGVLTRPTAREVIAYRAAIDARVLALLESDAGRACDELPALVELGLNHEQQHQELMLTDVKHLFSLNAMAPALRDSLPAIAEAEAPKLEWISIESGVHAIGHEGDGFAFDNEAPRHRVFLEPYALASRLVTNAEFADFIEDGGYQQPELWLDVGWQTVQRDGWQHPLYWRKQGSEWSEFGLAGDRAWVGAEPVGHVSYIEADAFARWAGARLPTEAEWEVACSDLPVEGNFVESGRLHPDVAPSGSGIQQAFGDLWEWTQSAYAPYPGFRPANGAIAEYNGKFMCNQLVLRGGSCASSASHLRASYRNFFYAPDRWQFTGIRLAKEL